MKKILFALAALALPAAAMAAQPYGSAYLGTGQVAVGTTAVRIVTARPQRQRITVSVGSATACAFGNAGVTLTTGFPLQPVAGAALSLDTAAEVYAVCSASATVSFVEQF